MISPNIAHLFLSEKKEDGNEEEADEEEKELAVEEEEEKEEIKRIHITYLTHTDVELKCYVT